MSQETRKFVKGILLLREPGAITYLSVNEGMVYNNQNLELRTQIGGVDTKLITSAGADNLTNKSFEDSTTFVYDNLDNTKRLQFQLSGLTTATIRTITIPDASTTLVGTDATQTLTNKTIVPANNTISLNSAQILVGSASNNAASVAITGDISLSNAGDVQIVAGAIIDADVNASAAITRSKLAAGNANRMVVNSGAGVLSDAAAIIAARALISDANGIPTNSAVTSAELDFLTGVTSAIQTQLDTKLNDTGDVLTGNLTFNAQTEARLADADSSNYIALRSPAVVGANYTITLPAAAPANNTYLNYDGANYAWATVASSGGDVTAASNFDNDNRMLRSDGILKGSQASGIIVDDSNNMSGVNTLTSGSHITANAQSELRLADSDSSNYVALRSPAVVGTNYIITLPAAAPANNTYLNYDGANYIWATVGSSAGDVSAAANFGTDNRLIRSDGTLKVVQSSGITIDDSNNLVLPTQAELRLGDSDSSNYVGIRSAAVIGTDYTITLPSVSPSTDTYLKYNGTNYVWAVASGSGSATDGSYTQTLQYTTVTWFMSSPNATRYQITVSNQGALVSTSVGAGAVDNYKIEADDGQQISFSIDNFGNISTVHAADGAATLQNPLYLISPITTIFIVKAQLISAGVYELYTVIPLNSFRVQKTAAVPVFVVQEEVVGATTHVFRYTSGTLPAIPTAVTGCTATAMYDTGAAIRQIYYDTYLNAWRYTHDNSAV